MKSKRSATPSECFKARRHGADGLKLFPSSLLGIDGFKAISAVLPWGTDSYAVGGVNTENFANWPGAGVAGFGNPFEMGAGCEWGNPQFHDIHDRRIV